MELYVYTIMIEGNQMGALSVLAPDEVTEKGVPAEAVLGEVDPRTPDMTVDGFTPNEEFINFMSSIIGPLAETLPLMKEQAERIQNGPCYVMDFRSINTGQKPPFEDIIGWYGTKNGQIVPNTYNPNPNYKLLTNAGPIQLQPELEEALLKAIKEKAIERSGNSAS